jgi:hypothetical protein
MNRYRFIDRRNAVAIAVAAGALFATAAHAAPTYPVPSGDIMDVPMDAPQYTAPAVQAAAVSYESIDAKTAYTPAAAAGPLTRAEVREARANARASGTMAPSGEIGDTNETIAARDAFNELQAEVITARWNEEARVMAEAAAAERAALLAQQEIDAVLAMGARYADQDSMALNFADRREVLDESTEAVDPEVSIVSTEVSAREKAEPIK